MPPAENWVTVETKHASYHARDILTDKQTSRQAARSANDKITWAHWQSPELARRAWQASPLIKRLAVLDVGYHQFRGPLDVKRRQAGPVSEPMPVSARP